MLPKTSISDFLRTFAISKVVTPLSLSNRLLYNCQLLPRRTNIATSSKSLKTLMPPFPCTFSGHSLFSPLVKFFSTNPRQL
ncbi:hypothetical protein L596_027508 [Steinernema carpocapsae]|uniref:Uncharacterized protein n=1 Tax=Steinernema carpocapsae TaxID=34508 RepID=A0A4U5LVQ0_STECR|nr:hypothetical protein L596_027508 [Steinernema carpocapsae]